VKTWDAKVRVLLWQTELDWVDYFKIAALPKSDFRSAVFSCREKTACRGLTRIEARSEHDSPRCCTGEAEKNSMVFGWSNPAVSAYPPSVRRIG